MDMRIHRLSSDRGDKDSRRYGRCAWADPKNRISGPEAMDGIQSTEGKKGKTITNYSHHLLAAHKR